MKDSRSGCIDFAARADPRARPVSTTLEIQNRFCLRELSCQSYEETTLFPFKLNAFEFAVRYVMESWLESLLPAQRHAITTVKLWDEYAKKKIDGSFRKVISKVTRVYFTKKALDYFRSSRITPEEEKHVVEMIWQGERGSASHLEIKCAVCG